MQHHEQGVRRSALRHQHFPAHEILADHGAKSLQPLFGTERSEQREILRHAPPRKCRARLTHWRSRFDCSWNVIAGQLHGENIDSLRVPATQGVSI